MEAEGKVLIGPSPRHNLHTGITFFGEPENQFLSGVKICDGVALLRRQFRASGSAKGQRTGLATCQPAAPGARARAPMVLLSLGDIDKFKKKS